jgi:hypothetical protein
MSSPCFVVFRSVQGLRWIPYRNFLYVGKRREYAIPRLRRRGKPPFRQGIRGSRAYCFPPAHHELGKTARKRGSAAQPHGRTETYGMA